ncbi:hypothetical protein ScPMuIL_013202 [Solemya velum]
MGSTNILCRTGMQARCVLRTVAVIRPQHQQLSSLAPLTTASPTVQTIAHVRHRSTKAEIEQSVKEFKEGNFKNIPDPDSLQHFRSRESDVPNESHAIPIGQYTMPHPIWSREELKKVNVTHKPPEGFVDRAAYRCVLTMRRIFDILTRFNTGVRDEKKWIQRICFLETVAGVPGMIGAMFRHMRSLRLMRRDYGWIHTLLEEAENERMHLLTALQIKKPSWLFRTTVVGAQGVMVTMFSVAYVFSPKFCHRFVGYLEEEAVITYSKCLEDIESGSLKVWKSRPAPDLAIRYWKLPEDAKMVDVVLAIRADEAHHRLVNHTLASLKETEFNPYKPGQ